MSNNQKIYTRTGDKGETSLMGGTRVPKYHISIETYGTVDELNSYIGLIRDQQIDDHSKEILIEIQDRLFSAESRLACENETCRNRIPAIKDEDITLLENEIDNISKTLPELHSFILPGGHTTVSYCHIARCVCRRAERLAIFMSKDHPVDVLVIKYLNRLSDYLFTLARKFSMDTGSPEITWKARL